MRIKFGRKSRVFVASLSFGLLPLTPIANFPAKAATSITFENTSPEKVVLGALASRSQNGQLTKSGSAAPFTMTGTDSRSLTSYQFTTDVSYINSARLRESDERSPSGGGSLSSYQKTVATVDSKSNTIQLYSNGTIEEPPPLGLLSSDSLKRAELM